MTDPSLRSSIRATKGSFQTTKYIDEAYLTSIQRLAQCDSYTTYLAYLAELSTCCDTGIENMADPRVYAAKVPGSDPDMPSFHQAVNGKHAEEWVKAMQLEIATLVQQRTWTTVPRTPKFNVMKRRGHSNQSGYLTELHIVSKRVSVLEGTCKRRESTSSMPTPQLSDGRLFGFC